MRSRRESPSTVDPVDNNDEIRSLRDSVAAREAVLARISEGVLLVDRSGRIDYSNRPAVAMLGRRFDLASELVPAALRDLVLSSRPPGATPGNGESGEHLIDSGNAVFAVKVVAAGPDEATVVILRDVTRARSTERLRRDFVANASHELKTPVASILALAGAVRAALAAGNAEAVSRFSARLEREAERLAALVGDLLELSRLEGGTLKRGEVRIDRVVESESERLRPRAEQTGLKLTVTCPVPLAVLGSEPELEHMVHNLIDNAMRYTPAGGAVDVCAARDGDAAEISVADTGIGIPEPDLDRIFERFYRVDVARTRETGGTGLGLSIVRNIVETHGGTVDVKSVMDQGSTFTVRLPLAYSHIYKDVRDLSASPKTTSVAERSVRT